MPLLLPIIFIAWVLLAVVALALCASAKRGDEKMPRPEALRDSVLGRFVA